MREPAVDEPALRARGWQVVGDDRDLRRDPPGREHGAVAVEDVAARRRDRDVADDVGGGLGGVLGAGQDLQVPQAEGDHAEQQEDDDAEHAHATGQLWRQRRAALERALDHDRESGLRPPVV